MLAVEWDGPALVLSFEGGEGGLLGMPRSGAEGMGPQGRRFPREKAGMTEGVQHACLRPQGEVAMQASVPVRTGGKGIRAAAARGAWRRIKGFASRHEYRCLLAYNTACYLALALISLSPNGTVGKLSPIHLEMHGNRFLAGLLRVTRLYDASGLQLQIAFMVLTLMIMGGFLWAISVFRRMDLSFSAVAGFAVLLSIILVFTPPLLSKDLFSYIYYGRTLSVYGMNPYEVTPQMLPDPLLFFVGRYWKNTGSVYGPLFTYFSALLTLVAGRGITANIYAFKGCMALFHLANTAMIWDLLKRSDPERRSFLSMLYAWNPLVLMMSVGGGHNDIMMMTLALLALVFLQRGRRQLFFLALTLSVMVKFITGILLIAYLIHLTAKRIPGREKLKEAAALLCIFLALTIAFYLPFWRGPGTARYFLQNLSLHNFFSPGGLLSALFASALRFLLWFPRGTADLLGGIMARMILTPVFLLALWRKPRQASCDLEMGECFFAVIMAYILTVNFFNPWYMVWAFAFLPLRPWDRVSWAALAGGNLSMTWGSSLRPY